MEFVTELALASDADQLAAAGGMFWVLAAICLVLDRWRERRRSVEQLERVGFMPWTNLFVAFAIMGGGCLAMSLPVVLGNL